MGWEGDNIKIGFHPVTPQLIDINSCQVEAETIQPTSPEMGRPECDPRPDTGSASFYFKSEINWQPFQLNIGTEANLTWEQQSHFINLMYDKEVFSLHDEDLSCCDWLKHTIPTTTDKPVYLWHHMIPRQLQGEVCKCLDTWLHQGIIWPSQSPYASQVVIMCKKWGEIPICIDYCKINSITVIDAFPLPWIDETLQAVHSGNWFLIIWPHSGVPSFCHGGRSHEEDSF